MEAVRHGSGPLLIFAGAGSGKTRVLTRRIANLLLEHRHRPEEIFAVTFTNKAAREMKERIALLLDQRQVPYWVSTFHSSCAKILRRHAGSLNYTSNFAIYDSSESLSVLKRVYKRKKIDPKMIDPRSVIHQIDRAKNDYRFPDNIRKDSHGKPGWAEKVADLYESYQEEL